MGAKPLSFTIALAMLVIAAILMVKGDPNTTEVDTICSPDKIKDVYPGKDADVYSQNVAKTLDHLVFLAAEESVGPPYAYGFAVCASNVITGECFPCLKAALSTIQICGGKIGARSVLGDCSLKYDNYTGYF